MTDVACAFLYCSNSLHQPAPPNRSDAYEGRARRWISKVLHNYCMLLPGPEATQLAVYIGWLLHRTRGGIIAGVLFILPSLLILIGLAWVYLAFGHLTLVTGIMNGIKPAVVAIVLGAAWRIGSRTLRNGILVAIACAAFVAIALLHLPFPLIVLGAALCGVLGARLRPQAFQPGGAHGGSTPRALRHACARSSTTIRRRPPHARFSRAGWRR
jgi:chromate transporter